MGLPLIRKIMLGGGVLLSLSVAKPAAKSPEMIASYWLENADANVIKQVADKFEVVDRQGNSFKFTSK